MFFHLVADYASKLINVRLFGESLPVFHMVRSWTNEGRLNYWWIWNEDLVVGQIVVWSTFQLYKLGIIYILPHVMYPSHQFCPFIMPYTTIHYVTTTAELKLSKGLILALLLFFL